MERGRVSISCLVCGSDDVKKPLTSSRFPGLVSGSSYSIYLCDGCDFGFAHPRPTPIEANNWYQTASVALPQTNPQTLSLQKQVDRIVGQIPNRLAQINILDLGCGAGDLLRSLKKVFPNANLLGMDVFDAPFTRDFVYSTSLEGIQDALNCLANNKLDVLILSHVLEHFSDFQLIEDAVELLALGGMIYVEVPDANRYAEFGRDQIFYYFDGTHINHFSTRSLTTLLLRLECCPSRVWFDSFDYVDSNPYPIVAVNGVRTPSFAKRLASYFEQELFRSQEMRAKLTKLGGQGVAVWGAGQNFLRLDQLGVFRDCAKLFLLDRNKSGHEIRLSSNGRSIRIQDPEDFLDGDLRVPIFVSSTWHFSEIAERVRASWPNAEIFRL